MSTVPPSTAKGKTAKATGVDVGAAQPSVGAPSSKLARRRPPVLVWALLGAMLAGAYGHFALGMRLGPPLVMVALGGLTLALSAAALWRVIDPLTRNAMVAITETRAPHRIRELEREKQAVLKAIKEIELDYQMRKISEVDYREMVERYRTRALRLMGDLAAGDDYRALIERELKGRLAARAAAGSGESAPSETGADMRVAGTLSDAACPACSTPNDSDAQYCKRCGQKLTVSDAPV